MSALSSETNNHNGGQEGIEHKGTIVVSAKGEVLGDIAAIIQAGDIQTEPTKADEEAYTAFFEEWLSFGSTLTYEEDSGDNFPDVWPSSMTH